ncbi:hypothetical protein HDU96_009047 [Phlyctochytrium bullatum]|nr:hypothetical protein HDU96_009047 [Phlyctochytrium bullatum]
MPPQLDVRDHDNDTSSDATPTLRTTTAIISRTTAAFASTTSSASTSTVHTSFPPSEDCSILHDAFGSSLRISRTDCCLWTRIKCENGRIVELNLIEVGLHGPIPDVLAKLTELRDLLLSNNALKSRIPESLGTLEELRNLWVSNNQLDGKVPESLGNLSKLEQIHLNHNKSLAENCFTPKDIPESLKTRNLGSGGYIFPQRTDCEDAGIGIVTQLPNTRLGGVMNRPAAFKSIASHPVGTFETATSGDTTADTEGDGSGFQRPGTVTMVLPLAIIGFAFLLLGVLAYLRHRWGAESGSRRRGFPGPASGPQMGYARTDGSADWEALEDDEEDEDVEVGGAPAGGQGNQRMREIVITKAGGTDVLKIQERQDPTPGKGEIRIRVKASGINFADIMARMGLYPDAPPLPTVVGYEVSGVVDAIGEGVEQSWKDKEVVAFTRFKGYADTVVVSKDFVVEKPSNLSFVDAASIPVVYLTAWMLIVHSGGLRKGQTLLIQNAGGGVGLAAIDIGRHIGATMIGTASAKKHEFLKSRGLHHAIDYRTQDFVTEVKRITQGKGVDLIIDPVGGDAWEKNYSILRAGGRLGAFGASVLQESASKGLLGKITGAASLFYNMPKWSPLTLMNDNKSVFGVNLGHMWDEHERLMEWFKEILDGTTEGWARPYVDSVFDFDNVAKAHEFIEGRNNIGKVILVPTAAEAQAWTAAKKK